MDQQISRPRSRRSRRKPSFWQAHRTLSISLMGAASVAFVAAASVAVYEHRMAAEHIGLATRNAPTAPAATVASASQAQVRVAANAPEAAPVAEIKHDAIAVASSTPAAAAAAPDQPTDTVATADTLPTDGPSSAGGASGAGNIVPTSASTTGLGNGPSSGGGGGGNFGGTPQVASTLPAPSPMSFPSTPAPSGGPSVAPKVPVVTPPTGPIATGPKPVITPPAPVVTPSVQGPTASNCCVLPPPAPPAPGPSTPVKAPVQTAQVNLPTGGAQTPGQNPSNPIMPNNPSATGPNILPIPKGANGWTYFDPLVAIGYNYQLQASNPGSPLTFGITDIRAVTQIGTGQYQLFLFDVLSNSFVDVGQQILAGANSDFDVVAYLKTLNQAQDAEFGIIDPNAGLTQFSLRGIDPSAGLDPNDPNAFITGLMFDGTINGILAITPLELDTSTGNDPDGTTRLVNLTVPEPGTMTVFGLGLLGMAWLRRRRAA